MPELRLLYADKQRQKITVAQERAIRSLYREALKDMRDWSERLKGKENISSVLRREYLDQMEKDLNAELSKIDKQLKETIEANISMTAAAVVKDANNILNDFGLSLSAAYSFVPSDVVQAISTGTIYSGNWTLSKAIWGHSQKTRKDIHTIIAKGVAENKSSYDIAKELEKYVNPSAAKPWNWGKVYPGTSRKIDYNAQRLARTLVSHAYQQSFVRTTKDNPFFEGYRWLTANNHKVCKICQGYEEDIHDSSLPAGVFPKDDLPLDHPNGQCTMSIYTTQSTEQIVDSLVAWAHGTENEDLDSFAESLGYPVEQVKHNVMSNSSKP